MVIQIKDKGGSGLGHRGKKIMGSGGDGSSLER
jgi:hypothetical protein